MQNTFQIKLSDDKLYKIVAHNQIEAIKKLHIENKRKIKEYNLFVKSIEIV